ncbi:MULTISPECIES: quinone oxidoreductase family protein [Chitinophagaceae]
MKAIVLNGVKQPLIVEDVNEPILNPGEVLVKVKAAGFNHRDWWIQQGQYAGLKFPIILGSDGSGTVEKVHDTEDAHWIGKDVVISPFIDWGNNERVPGDNNTVLGLPENGCWAEYVKVPIANIYPKIDHLSFLENAAIPVAGGTAWRALMVRGRCQKGDKVLISGAGGGGAVFAVQYAVAIGADVYVTSGSEEKIQRAVELGAKAGVNYHDDNWGEELKAMVGSFDVIVDSALGKGFAILVDLAAKGGTIAFFGATAGLIPELNGRVIFSKQLNICGTSGASPRDFQAMLDFIKTHQLKPVIDAVFPFEEAENAMRSMDHGNTKYGKVLIEIA